MTNLIGRSITRTLEIDSFCHGNANMLPNVLHICILAASTMLLIIFVCSLVACSFVLETARQANLGESAFALAELAVARWLGYFLLPHLMPGYHSRWPNLLKISSAYASINLVVTTAFAVFYLKHPERREYHLQHKGKEPDTCKDFARDLAWELRHRPLLERRFAVLFVILCRAILLGLGWAFYLNLPVWVQLILCLRE
ncbi:hypothetical protein R1flu_028554 [Riccia fluitans]|uniref:Uncharacterized protein n=1 Tax=Riccia fluitans TaxID=41844 RepID=A0ABD1XM06_9MARC